MGETEYMELVSGSQPETGATHEVLYEKGVIQAKAICLTNFYLARNMKLPIWQNLSDKISIWIFLPDRSE